MIKFVVKKNHQKIMKCNKTIKKNMNYEKTIYFYYFNIMFGIMYYK